MSNERPEPFKSGDGSPPEQTELEGAVQAAYIDWKNANEDFHKAYKTRLEFAHELGTLLIQMKAELDHGAWLPTLKRCGISERTAQRFMRVAGAKSANLGGFENVHQFEQAHAKPKTSYQIPDYHHRHWLENFKKVQAVDPELADEVRNDEVSLRDAMARTKSARIAAGREKEAERISNLSDEERESAAKLKFNEHHRSY